MKDIHNPWEAVQLLIYYLLMMEYISPGFNTQNFNRKIRFDHLAFHSNSDSSWLLSVMRISRMSCKVSEIARPDGPDGPRRPYRPHGHVLDLMDLIELLDVIVSPLLLNIRNYQ